VINEVLDSPYKRIGEAMKKEMQSISLQQLCDDYRRLHQIEKEKKQS